MYGYLSRQLLLGDNLGLDRESGCTDTGKMPPHGILAHARDLLGGAGEDLHGTS